MFVLILILKQQSAIYKSVLIKHGLTHDIKHKFHGHHHGAIIWQGIFPSQQKWFIFYDQKP